MIPVALAVLLALAQAAAQAKPAPVPAPSPAPTRAEPPPYEADLLRLAEVMGALAFLRDLCHDGDGAAFRAKIAKLIETDPRSQEDKDQIAGAFNRGFEGYRLTYRACTSNAKDSISAYLKESERLVRDVAARYGGG